MSKIARLVEVQDLDGRHVAPGIPKPHRARAGKKQRSEHVLAVMSNSAGRMLSLDDINVTNKIENFKIRYRSAKTIDDRLDMLDVAITDFATFCNVTRDRPAKTLANKFLIILEKTHVNLTKLLPKEEALSEAKTAAPVVASAPEEKKRKKKKKKKPQVVEASSPELKPDEGVASTSAIFAMLDNSSQAVAPLEEPVAEVKEVSVVAEKDPLFALKEILDVTTNLERAEIPVGALTNDVEKLKTVSRDDAFWKCINDGFLKGHGELFLKTLQEQGAFEILFPSMGDDAESRQENNDWFKARLKKQDENYKEFMKAEREARKSGIPCERTKPEPYPSFVAALLIAKESSFDSSDAEKRKVHEAYQIPFSYDSLEAHIQYQHAHKFALFKGEAFSAFIHSGMWKAKPVKEVSLAKDAMTAQYQPGR